jgi:transcriptional regulator with PAS, ATPase and Fis domain
MNICERLVVMTETNLIDLKDLPAEVAGGSSSTPAPATAWPEEMTLQETLESVERSVLQKALEKYGNQVRIAEALGVNQSTVARKLKKHGLG